ALECAELLDKIPDVITPNGFEPNFVPKKAQYEAKRKQAREALINIATALTGKNYSSENTCLVATSGRYEYKNKGIDLFIDALNRLRAKVDMNNKQVLAFVLVPADVKECRLDLLKNIESKAKRKTSLPNPIITHDLNNMDSDYVLNQMKWLGFTNDKTDSVHLIFVPIYLDGADALFNKEYYDLLIGLDLTVLPSYYEPWGYTPLESIAFGVPTITTDLAGFGRWAEDVCDTNSLSSGINVIHRTDTNQIEVSDAIAKMLDDYIHLDVMRQDEIRAQALLDSELADWGHFISRYLQAYDIAFHNANMRVQK
ncbi:MAG: glycosyltransferase, partial [Bacteroidales bacterium]